MKEKGEGRKKQEKKKKETKNGGNVIEKID